MRIFMPLLPGALQVPVNYATDSFKEAICWFPSCAIWQPAVHVHLMAVEITVEIKVIPIITYNPPPSVFIRLD